MKPLFFSLLISMLAGCGQQQANSTSKTEKADSSNASATIKPYAPGFGEFMSSIQVHHEKLWFAGINNNWQLADFEINEIKEALRGIEDYCTDRPERKSLTMIYPAIDSISSAIQQKNLGSFKSNFTILTQTCNTCHKATDHGFNVIQIPTTPPFSNQSFNLSN
ncbi:MAG: hypothetical protein KGO81_05480 [Bacteroidota bacterium]|nr:hypothetical protein [Bacteroidota bacterium]